MRQEDSCKADPKARNRGRVTPLGANASRGAGSPEGLAGLIVADGRLALRGKNGSVRPPGTHRPPDREWRDGEIPASREPARRNRRHRRRSVQPLALRVRLHPDHLRSSTATSLRCRTTCSSAGTNRANRSRNRAPMSPATPRCWLTFAIAASPRPRIWPPGIATRSR